MKSGIGADHPSEICNASPQRCQSANVEQPWPVVSSTVICELLTSKRLDIGRNRSKTEGYPGGNSAITERLKEVKGKEDDNDQENPEENKNLVYFPTFSKTVCMDPAISNWEDIPKNVTQLTLIDCRYPYEYFGGHIIHAVNIFEWPKLKSMLFKYTENERRTRSNANSPTSEGLAINHTSGIMSDSETRSKRRLSGKHQLIVLYCEFSSRRAPQLFHLLRNHDRLVNFSYYPYLTYPNVYVLRDGYAAFNQRFPELCFPQGGYIHMDSNSVQMAYWRKCCNLTNSRNTGRLQMSIEAGNTEQISANLAWNDGKEDEENEVMNSR